MQETADQHWINLVRIGSIVGLVVPGGGAVATFLGFDKIDDVAERTVARMSNAWEQQFASSLSEVDLISLGEMDAWSTLRTGLSGLFEAAPAGEGEQARQQRAEAVFAAAHLIAERSAAGDLPARRYFSVDALGRQLDAEALARHLQPWPAGAPVGVDLVARVTPEGLTRDPTSWNRFYWHYPCDLLCDLGCRAPAGDGSGGWCKQCLDALQRQYAAAGIRVDRSAASCARG
jgi:hypothetical protein